MKREQTVRASKAAPSDDESLTAYQTAFHHELNENLDLLPLTPASRVLDVPCGNGFYSKLLANRLTDAGRMDAVDLNRDYLARTRKRLRGAACDWAVHESDAYHLPFPDDVFDLVWCAQSLISLDDASAAIQEMKRVVRPGGTIAILENDVFHYVLLPWPVHLEIPILQAIQLASRARFGSDSKYSPVRRLPHLLASENLHRIRKHTFAADRTAPWPAATKAFLECHLAELKHMVRGRLSPQARAAFRRFIDARHSESVFGDRSMDVTCLNVIYLASK